MLRAKLHFPHPHHWVPMVFDLSRTIHWLREAAQSRAPYGTRRANLEEVGLTWLFLATLAIWTCDTTRRQARAGRFLKNRLRDADGAVQKNFRLGPAAWRAGGRLMSDPTVTAPLRRYLEWQLNPDAGSAGRFLAPEL